MGSNLPHKSLDISTYVDYNKRTVSSLKEKTTMAMIYERTATGELTIKRVAAYLKSSHKENPIRVERCPDGTFLLADGYVAVSVPAHPDLFPYTHVDAMWQYASF